MNKNGQESFYYLQQAAKAELLYLKKMEIEEVELSGGSCPSCKQLKRKVLKIDEALEQMPIPNKNCSHILYDKKRGFCRCSYYSSSEITRKVRNQY